MTTIDLPELTTHMQRALADYAAARGQELVVERNGAHRRISFRRKYRPLGERK